jgi:ElaB/YqjD/DUF883 family membrane-anchored ribosome-binding protein
MNDHPGDRGASAGAQAQELASLALQYAAVARGRIAEGKARITEYVHREPVRAVGLALGVGVLIGWWTKRR